MRRLRSLYHWTNDPLQLVTTKKWRNGFLVSGILGSSPEKSTLYYHTVISWIQVNIEIILHLILGSRKIKPSQPDWKMRDLRGILFILPNTRVKKMQLSFILIFLSKFSLQRFKLKYGVLCSFQKLSKNQEKWTKTVKVRLFYSSCQCMKITIQKWYINGSYYMFSYFLFWNSFLDGLLDTYCIRKL